MCMTYRELDEAANRLAHLLVGYGAGPGQCVGLLLERSIQAVVAMVAVLKSGAAYLAIDPALPDARIDFMLADAGPVAVLTTTGLADRLDGHEVAVIDIDDPAVETQPGTALPGPVPADLAYLIYTSAPRGRQRGGHHPPQPGSSSGVVAPHLPGLRCGRSFIRMRLTFRCGRFGVRCCMVGGWWWCPIRWPAPRRLP
ncbi:AMP-binding enzyme family protein [Mycobacterium xenopi 4042]|uniref:AMP-binding enzyme family protein n=1 Tax=Mycobacterium xenopi 4042 TaxID=1299334 RepID=X8E8A5_MYCXE|nr:AMP-binding enzyme family protein [Mycobacterium xenopi 4042]